MNGGLMVDQEADTVGELEDGAAWEGDDVVLERWIASGEGRVDLED